MFTITKVDDNALYYTCTSCKTKAKCIVKSLTHNVFLNLMCPNCLDTMNVLVTAENNSPTDSYSWTPIIKTDLLT